MFRLAVLVGIFLFSQLGFANPIAEMFERYRAGEELLIEIQKNSPFCLEVFIPKNFTIAYAPDNLSTCEFVPDDQSIENWTKKIIVNYYSDADIESVVPAYDSFIKGIGGEEVIHEYQWGNFLFENNSILYADHVHTGPHVLPRLKLRSSTESEVCVTRFIQADCGVLQVSLIIKSDSEGFHRIAKPLISQGRALINQWKVIDISKQEKPIEKEKPANMPPIEIALDEEPRPIIPRPPSPIEIPRPTILPIEEETEEDLLDEANDCFWDWVNTISCGDTEE